EEWEYEDDEADESTGAEAELTVRTPATKQEPLPQVEADSAAPDEEGVEAPQGKLNSALGLGKGKKLLKRSEREEVISQLEAADQQPPTSNFDYELPPLDLLLEPENVSYEEHEKEVRRKARILEKTFKNF